MKFFENIFGKNKKEPEVKPSENIVEKRKSPLTTPEEEVLEKRETSKKGKMLKEGVNKIHFIEFRGDGSGVFKPASGERAELRDQVEKGTYYKRERAAYLVSRFLDLDLVPPTVIREIDSEIGSVQQFIPDAKVAWEISEEEKRDDRLRIQLMKLWLFDYIITNSDRHGGNLLFKKGKIYAIDNGLSFGGGCACYFREDYFDVPIPKEIIDKFEKFVSWKEGKEILRDLLDELLKENEADACLKRIEWIAELIHNGDIPRSMRKEFEKSIEIK